MSWRSNPAPTIKPPFGSYIDWSHPLAPVEAVVLSEAEGITANCLGITNNQVNIVGATWCTGGLCFNQNYAEFPFFKFPGGGIIGEVGQPYSVAVKFATTSTIIGYGAMLSTWDVVGSYPATFRLGTGTVAGQLGFPIYDGTNVAMPVVNGVNDGNPHLAIGVRDTTKTQLNLFFDGVLADSVVDGVGDCSNGNNWRLGLDLDGDTTDAYVGNIFLVYIWDRALTADEAAWLHAEPYCFIAWPSRRVIFDFGAITAVTYLAQDTIFTPSDTIFPLRNFSRLSLDSILLTENLLKITNAIKTEQIVNLSDLDLPTAIRNITEGEAIVNISDSTIQSIVRKIIESEQIVNLSEIIQKNIKSVITENITIYDDYVAQIAGVIRKLFQDSVILFDLLNKKEEKKLTESLISLLDSVVKFVSIKEIDQINNLTDKNLKSIFRFEIFADSFVIHDLYNKIIKLITTDEIINISDLKQTLLSKTLAETITIFSDLFKKALEKLSTEDLQIITDDYNATIIAAITNLVTKLFADNITISDLLKKEERKYLSEEVISIIDSENINITRFAVAVFYILSEIKDLTGKNSDIKNFLGLDSDIK